MYYSFLIAFTLLLLYKTNVIVEYLELFGVKLKEFEAKRLMFGANYTIFEHLAAKYPCFLTRLLACPVCLSTWLGMGAFFFYAPYKLPSIVIGGLAAYWGLLILKKYGADSN
jgi:hypothetical protein